MQTKFYCSDHVNNEDNNSKYASSLLCSNNWSSFKKEYADYAIGSPTIEMWVASWNNKHGEHTEEKGKKGVTLYANGNNNIGKGYFIGDTENCTTTSIYLNETEGYNDSLYFPHHKGTGIDIINHTDSGDISINEYWLSSPAGQNTNNYNVLVVFYTGNIKPDPPSYTCGFRPIICLNSSVKIIKNEDKSNENKIVFDLSK